MLRLNIVDTCILYCFSATVLSKICWPISVSWYICLSFLQRGFSQWKRVKHRRRTHAKWIIWDKKKKGLFLREEKKQQITVFWWWQKYKIKISDSLLQLKNSTEEEKLLDLHEEDSKQLDARAQFFTFYLHLHLCWLVWPCSIHTLYTRINV